MQKRTKNLDPTMKPFSSIDNYQIILKFTQLKIYLEPFTGHLNILQILFF